MSPDLYFVLTLVVRMAVTAGFLLAATIIAERAGPLIGGLVATLPISAGPVYIFLALDHDAAFIAHGALGSLVTNALNVIFALVYVLLAQKRSLTISLASAFAVWIALTYSAGFVRWTLLLAIILNLAALAVSLWLSAPMRHVRAPVVHARWYDLVMRAAMVALLVGVVVTLSFRIGPTASGNLAVFPIVLTSLILILHRRIGGKPTAAVMANAVIGLAGFGVAVMVLHLTAVPLGSALALALTLLVSMGGNLIIFLMRRRAAAAAAAAGSGGVP
ncbi:MAG: hypothetical protein JOZ70_00155 [Pseudolabrys sp.]|nr:hypothetical protein [Pseudolabrys sp.]MBV9953635.1 hypothetical protein [Pseudolabrys sp.]